LIVGHGDGAQALAEELRQEGHAVDAVAEVDRLGELLRALEHVAIVCWLAVEASPERFLLGAVDSSMRGFLYSAGDWERAILEIAARNSIPVAALMSDPDDVAVWLAEARDAVASLLEAPGGSTPARYADQQSL
jgi:hypothetical protein